MIKEVVMHEIPIALIVFMGKPQIFIHIEGDHIGKTQFTSLIHPCQFLIHADGAGTCRQAKHERTILLMSPDLRSDIVRCPLAHLVVIFLNHYTHYHVLSFCGLSAATVLLFPCTDWAE